MSFTWKGPHQVLWETDLYKLVLCSKFTYTDQEEPVSTPKPTRRAPKKRINRQLLASASEESDHEDVKHTEAAAPAKRRMVVLSSSDEDASEAVEWDERAKRPQRAKKTVAQQTLDASAFVPFSADEIRVERSRLQNAPRPGETYFDDHQVNFLLKIYNSVDPERDELKRAVQPRSPERKLNEILAYDDAGTRLSRVGAAELRDASFLVMPNGTVLSPHSPEPVFAFFEDSDGDIKMAPGVVDHFFYSPKQANQTYCGIMVMFKWFVTDDEFDVHHESKEAQFVTELSSLSIECIACNVSMLPFKLLPHLAYNYWCSLNRWNLEHKRKLKSCRAPCPASARCDVYDALEFYYAKDEWVWRTAVGEFIQRNFVNPFKSFGLCNDAHNLKVLCDVMQARTFVFRERDAFQDVCEACRMTRILRFEVVCPEETYQVGCECAERLKFFNTVASLVHAQRNVECSWSGVLWLLDRLTIFADELRVYQARLRD